MHTELPPLARSLYYTTDLDREIPRGLFQAVAQVLAWVLGTKAYREGKAPSLLESWIKNYLSQMSLSSKI